MFPARALFHWAIPVIVTAGTRPAQATSPHHGHRAGSFFLGLVYFVCALIPLAVLIGGLWGVNVRKRGKPGDQLR